MSGILGIRCTITDARLRDTIGFVLKSIRERRPEDFERLRAKVKGFHWLPQREAQDGTVGHFKHTAKVTKALRAEIDRDAKALAERAYPSGAGPFQEALARELEQDLHRRPGKVYLCRELADAPEFQRLATIAHELGHAATTQGDFEKRDDVVRTANWASESCADYYAYRWGFGRQVRRSQPTRHVAHHGGLPGQDVEIAGPNGTTLRYRVTRHFYYRQIEPSEID